MACSKGSGTATLWNYRARESGLVEWGRGGLRVSSVLLPGKRSCVNVHTSLLSARDGPCTRPAHRRIGRDPIRSPFPLDPRAARLVRLAGMDDSHPLWLGQSLAAPAG